MKRSHLAFAFGVLFALAIAVPASAQNARPGSSNLSPVNSSGLPGFDSLDRQHPGYLTRNDIPKDAEGMQELRAHFRENDRDHNGRLDPTEYAVYVLNQAPAYETTPRTGADMQAGSGLPSTASGSH